ncbi:MAG: hypothetical protein HEQ32_02510 [Vampirovibrio sp.]
MIPSPSAPAYSLSPVASSVPARQRTGATVASPEMQRFIQSLQERPDWKASEHLMQDAAKHLNYALSPSWHTNVERLKYWILDLGTQIRSNTMGSIRNIRYNFEPVMNRLMPGIQDWINQDLKVRDDTKTIKIGTKVIPVRFVQYHLKKAKNADGIFRVPFFGDTGYPNSTLQYNIDGSIALAKAQGHQMDAAIILGDLLYPPNEHYRNNTAYDSGDVRLMWRHVGKPFQHFIRNKTPVFSVLGNNDAQLGQEDVLAHFMSVPRYYQVSLGDSADLFFLDENAFSTIQAKNMDQLYKTNHFTEAYTALKEAQLYWLEAALKESKAKHPDRKRIILKHFPDIPADPHVADHPFMVQKRHTFDRFLTDEATYGVTGVMNGHEHHMAMQSLSHTVDEAGQVQAVPNPTLHFTLGSTSHGEPLPAHMKNHTYIAQRMINTAMASPQSPSLIQTDTGFGLLEVNPTTGEIHINFIQPPLTNDTYYHGERVNVGEMDPEDEHGDRYRLILRMLFERGALNNIAQYQNVNQRTRHKK